jgi:hypothetical protein
MLVTARKVAELRKLGIVAPRRPVPPFPHLPADPMPEEIELDRVYQEQCMVWVAEVAALYEEHCDSID